jgi:hypothetical protein
MFDAVGGPSFEVLESGFPSLTLLIGV